MKITWLGNTGLLLECERARILVDPAEGCDAAADILLLTGSCGKYFSKETVRAFLEKNPEATVLLPRGAYQALSVVIGNYNFVCFGAHSVWSERNITFYAVRTENPDPTAVGFIVDDGSKTYYISGATLYNYEVIDDVLELVEDGVDYAFLPINGRDGSMNAKDAADFAYELGAENAVPLYYGERPGNPDDFDFEEGKIVLLPNTPLEL